jgi:5-oxoprolinase (ATP-hydrolysing) subunit A
VEIGTEEMNVSINSDIGESFGIHSFGNDDGLLPLIDTANVACGFHAGDPVGMHEMVAKASGAGITVGAHPGLPDPVGFGRREMKLFPEEVRDIVLYQVGALSAFLAAEGLALDHIKPHGSLYGMVARDEQLMDAVCDVAVQYEVPVYGMAGTAHEEVAKRRGVGFVSEFYVDLGYRADGSLIIPRRPSATPPEVAVARARRALADGVTEADTGERVPVRVESICVHSDTPNAVDVATAVRRELDARTGTADSNEGAR